MLPSQGVLGDALDDLGIHWEPLHVVGGDYFWLERFGDQSLLLIFDCTGHGVPGAFMTLVVASALDRILHEQKLRAPGQILAALDAMVRARLRQDRADADSDDGLEAAACLWDMTRRTVTFSGAGLPLFHGAPGEPLTEIRGDRAALGYCSLPSRGTFTDHVVRVASGHSFYLTTDGAHDQMGGAPRRLLGRRRLTALIALHRDRPMAEQVRLLSEALSDYRGDEPRRDDETVIGFTVA